MNVQTAVPKKPMRLVFHAVEGFGKTSFAAFFPSPVFLMSKGETGLLTLMQAGRIPETPYYPECESWEKMKANLIELAKEEHEYKTVVIDTGNGSEQMCHEFVCNRDYGGDWGEKGFTAFQRGFKVAATVWRGLLFSGLDTLRERRGMNIVILCHASVRTFNNPEGPDYDRYLAQMHKDTWAVTAGWADIILFGNYLTQVVEGKAQGKSRVLYTERCAAFDAKNRHGLPSQLNCGASADEAYGIFNKALPEKCKLA